MRLPFKNPDWYDPEKNFIVDLDWRSSDVFEAWDTITGERVPCVVGSNFIRLYATDARWGNKVVFENDGLCEEHHLLIDPDSLYQYYPISRYARFIERRKVQLYDKVEVDYSIHKWIVYKIDERSQKVSVTNGDSRRAFEISEIEIVESLTKPKTFKEQIKCVLSRIAHTKIIKAITGMFAG